MIVVAGRPATGYEIEYGDMAKAELTAKGDSEMIKIHIRRSVTDENKEALMTLIRQLRSTIVGQPGYLSSETLNRVDTPGEILVVSKWQSDFYWRQWYDSPTRAEIQAEIDDLLGTETRYEIYEFE
jgi:heme-degrading monooxygenase HmoA